MDIWVCYKDVREFILVCDSAVAHPGKIFKDNTTTVILFLTIIVKSSISPVALKVSISSHRLFPLEIHCDLVVRVHQSDKSWSLSWKSDESFVFPCHWISQPCVKNVSIPQKLQTCWKMKFLIPNKLSKECGSSISNLYHLALSTCRTILSKYIFWDKYSGQIFSGVGIVFWN